MRIYIYPYIYIYICMYMYTCIFDNCCFYYLKQQFGTLDQGSSVAQIHTDLSSHFLAESNRRSRD